MKIEVGKSLYEVVHNAHNIDMFDKSEHSGGNYTQSS